jgi:hypothetical protein
MDFLDRFRGRPPHLEQRLTWHRERGEPVVREVEREYTARGYRERVSSVPAALALKDDGGLALSVLVTVADSAHWWADDLRAALTRRRLPYERVDVELLTVLATERRDSTWDEARRVRAAVASVERYAADHGVDSVEDLVLRLKEVVAERGDGSEWTALAVRLRGLVPEAVAFDSSLFAGSDPWARAVGPVVERELGGEGALLAQLAGAVQSRPSKKWLEATGSLLGDNGARLIRILLESARDVEAVEASRFEWDGRTYVQMLWLSDQSATLLRGALWACPLVDGDWRVAVADALVRRSMREEQIKVANAALHALGEIADDEAIATLSALAARVKDKRFSKGIARALDVAAAGRGLTPGQLRESVVPAMGLGSAASAEHRVGELVARIELEAPARVTTTWAAADGTETKSAPASLAESDAAGVRDVKTHVAEIRKELAVQRLRLEALLADDRTWHYADWRRHYFEHPLVQVLARSVIWRFGDTAAVPLALDRFLLADGTTAGSAPDGDVRLWHPIHVATDEVARWRTLVREHEIAQPFKQAFREVYLVAPAEEATGTYSNRFAAHILRYPQAYALARQRGWSVVALGPYDNDGGRQWRDFAEQGIRAEFWLEHADHDFAGQGNLAELAATDQVRFRALGADEPMRVVDVPALVFSEAMRDVDLFVGVTSVAADPQWLDRGPDRYHAYWREASFGDLTESAIVRRELLAEILPSLKIADRLTLEERYLVVRGNLRTYRIHLGSANIQMEPDDQYLCIVPARGRGAGKVFLPFPEDDRFSVILSKAFLLAADDRITDPTITHQLRR